MPSMPWASWILIAGLLAVGSTGRADWLIFAQGGRADLPIEDHGSRVDVLAPWGRLTFPRPAFRSIVPTESLDAQWAIRRAAAERSQTAEARFAAGWWALERGLTPEAVAQFRAALASPGAAEHAPLLRLGRTMDRLDAARSEADLTAIEPLLGAGWSRLAGRHVLLVHQSSDADAAERLDVLDRVVATYYLSLAAQGIELPVPDRRLVSVWFARQADYVAALRRIEAAPFADTQGFYHPNFGVVFAYDTRSSGDQAGPRRDLARRRVSPDLTATQAAEIDRQSLLLDLRWRSVDLGIAAHETIHQLVALSRLSPRFDDFPIWLHEGFSAQFEVVRDGRWAGIGRSNDQRLPDWRSIQPSPQLAPLLRDVGLTHGYRRDRYAESWALVYFLRKTRPAEFVTFLDLLRTPRSIDARPAPEVTFQAAFGTDLAGLQAEWRQFLRAQVLPGEGHGVGRTLAKSP